LQIPDIPQDEQARLKTLRSLNILDTSPEERFDRLTRLAKRLFQVPIALVSLVDENRQWFKSCVGLSVSETPRDISFCGHAILGDEIFIVSDAMMDERFADNPLVVEAPHIRFYAGCPLRYPNGSKLGTLCIIDQVPRVLAAEDLETLKDLASTAERELAAIQLATLDELTMISNRRGFMMLAEHGIHLCRRQRIPASLIALDLDKFKPINDTFGHAEGDVALRAFASELKEACRDSDVFGRLGGDEFAVMLFDTNSVAAEKVAARLRQRLDQYSQKAKRGYEISFSYGIVDFDADRHHTVEAFLADGDALMYACKSQRGPQRQDVDASRFGARDT
jgi:diguanylate cyclase (GGDEF)-like protein